MSTFFCRWLPIGSRRGFSVAYTRTSGPDEAPVALPCLRRAHEEHLESRKSQRLADRNPISSWGGAREKGLLMTGIAETSALVSKTGGSRFESWVPR